MAAKPEHSWDRKQPMLVVADMRVGGTYLCCCLDSHPDVGCLREEPLHPESTWIKAFGAERMPQIVYTLWRRSGYWVSGFKVTYPQYALLRDNSMFEGVLIVHLLRGVVDTLLSHTISVMRNGDPYYRYHTYDKVLPHAVEIDPGWFARECANKLAERRSMLEALSDLSLPVGRRAKGMTTVWYEDIVPGEGGYMPRSASTALCDFLGVQHWELYSSTRPVNRGYSKDQLLTNWPDVQQAVRAEGIPEDYRAEMGHLAGAV